MVFEIAAGVCLGIVAAVVVLRYWRQLLKVSWFLVFWVVVVAALSWGGTRVWAHIGGILTTAGTVALAFACILVMMGIPLGGYQYAARRFPGLGALLHGKPPWDRPARVPARLLLMALFAAGVAALGIGGLFAAITIVGWILDFFVVQGRGR
jgi:hypothetical protein